MTFKKDEATGTICGFVHKPCIERQCIHYIKIRGKHPQSGADIDHWGCALAWLPILMIETTQQTRQAGAAVESLRNEMIAANRRILQLERRAPNPSSAEGATP